MAVKQEGALQQPRETTQQAASPAPEARQAPDTQAQQQSPGPDFSQLLEQHIAQAIQPVLDEFRQQMTQTLEQQPAAKQPETAQRTQEPAGEQSPTGQATQNAPAPEQAPAPQQAQPSAAPEATGQPSAPAQPQGLEALQPAVKETVAPALKTVEQTGVELLRSLLVAGLTALLTEPTAAAVRQRAEQGLHALLQKIFEAAPKGANNQEMQEKTERALQLVLGESLDAVFAEGMRASLKQDGQAAIQESFHGDFSKALKSVEDMLKAIAEALLNVLRREWQMLLRLALALVLLALESSLEQSKEA